MLYILPTLIVGDALGILNKTKIKFFTTLFLQSVVYSITNYLALYFGEIFYETKIIGFLISDPIIYENFALSILFILSGAEAIFSSIFTMENLKVLKITKDKEKQMPLYGYIACIIFYFLMILFYFCKLNNLFFLMIIFIIILAIPPFIEINKKIKHPTIIWTTYIIIFTLLNFLLCYLTLYYLIAILMALPLIIYCIVKIIFYIYNIRRKGE